MTIDGTLSFVDCITCSLRYSYLFSYWVWEGVGGGKGLRVARTHLLAKLLVAFLFSIVFHFHLKQSVNHAY